MIVIVDVLMLGVGWWWWQTQIHYHHCYSGAYCTADIGGVAVGMLTQVEGWWWLHCCCADRDSYHHQDIECDTHLNT